MKHLTSSLILLALLGGCDPDDPEKENVEETITRIILTFSPSSGGNDIVASATDPDGDGPQDVVFDGSINLENNLEYELALKFENTLETPPEDITAEIRAEGDEHLILFGWEGNLFSDPANGNIANNRSGIRYGDDDENGLPVGLFSSWTTAETAAQGTFRIVLKHQPGGLKTETSGISAGATDADITFDVQVGK